VVGVFFLLGPRLRDAALGPPSPAFGRPRRSAGCVGTLAGATKPLPRAPPSQRTSSGDPGGSNWSETALERVSFGLHRNGRSRSLLFPMGFRCSGLRMIQTCAGSYSPATVIPSIRTVGALVDWRNTRSFAGTSARNIASRCPAIVASDTGSANAPSRIMKPPAPRL